MNFVQEYDILVAGAGVAGIAAALETARAGFRTALLDKSILPGGLATSGLVNIYLPLCDGNGHQVTSGIAEELLRLSLRYGPGEIPAGWREAHNGAEHERFRVAFSPASFILALDEILQDAGVDIWYDTLVCTPQLDGQRVTGLEVENKSGRGLLRARCIIDATGDADIAFRAGAPCEEQGNWLSFWALHASLRAAEDAVHNNDGTKLLNMYCLGGDNAGFGAPPEIPKMSGTDGKQVTEFVLTGRRLLREYYAKRHANGGATSRTNLYPITLPAMAQFRTTRRVLGQQTLSDGQYGTAFDDSIGLIADWRKPGYVWEIPYGTLVPQRIQGLLTAGRCISSCGDAWEVTRVIPGAALTGQLAGIAARLAVTQGMTPDAISASEIQQELTRYRMPYHIADVIPAMAK